MKHIHQHIYTQLCMRSSQAWFAGYHKAYDIWHSDVSWQEFTNRVVEFWSQRIDPHKGDGDPVSPEIIAVACLNIALRRNAEDPGAWLQPLIEAPVPNMQEIYGKNASLRTPAEEAWYGLSYGLRSPRFDLLVKVWNGLTPTFRKLVEIEVPEGGGEMPEQFDSAAAMAWVEKTIAGWKPIDAVPVLSEYRDLAPGEAETWAGILIDQHAAWKELDVFRSGVGDMVGAFIPDRLAELVCYHAPLSDAMLSRAMELELDWPTTIRMRPGQDLVELETEVEMPGIKPGYFKSGYTLKEVSDRSESPQAVVASGSQKTKVGMRSSLLVVLDIDLTCKEVSFLGLTGKRLRICAPYASIDEPFFTRVDLNGGVKLMSLLQTVPHEKEDFDLGDNVYVLDRPMISPYEGLRDAGGCLGREERFGGAPNWEQYPEFPMSPVSGKPMTFLAQFEHALGGTLYAFLDFENLIAAVLVQND